MQRIIGVLLILLIALMGCGNNNEANVTEPINTLETVTDMQEENALPVGVHDPDELTFSSLEAFLLAYQALQLGEDITDYVESYFGELSGSTLESVTEGSNFASLEVLHLPIGIPDDYEIGRIVVRERFMEIAFFHIDDLVSEDSIWIAARQRRHFSFTILSWDYDEATLFSNMMREYGANEENLIDGRYLFREPNDFDWVSDCVRFILRTPLRQLNESNEPVPLTEIDGIPLDDPHEIAVFTETRTIDLTDEEEVIALIREIQNGDQGEDQDENQDEDQNEDLDEDQNEDQNENGNQDGNRSGSDDGD